MTKGKTIVKGALILTLANLVTRIMGFVYRIYMSKAIGPGGMGVYQLIMPVYMLVFSLCSSGLATTVSTCTAANGAKKDSGAARRVLNTAVSLSVCLSAAASAAVFFGAGFIGVNILHESRTILPLKIISLCFPFMSAGACLRGYFYGLQKMSVPAASQVLEQSVRIAVVWLLYDTMLTRGLEYACAAAVMGMAGGELAAFVFTLAAYYLRRGKYTATNLTYISALDTVLTMALPLTLNRGISACLSTAENILIPQKLTAFGLSGNDAVSLFGGLCGMAVPLIMFPCSLLTALATALMPAISEYSAAQNYAAIGRTMRRTLLFTTVIGIGVSGIFIAFPAEISRAVYGRTDISALLGLLGGICPFLYTQVILSAALNGLNCQLYIFKMGLLGSAITISAIYFLMPRFGIHAYIAGWAAAAVITNSLSRAKLEKMTGGFGTDPADIAKCLTAAAFICLFGKYICRHLRPDSMAETALITGCCCLGYLLLTDMLGVLETGDIISLIKGRR